MPEQMVAPIETALEGLEYAFFDARDHWPRPGWVEEYTAAFVRLREIYEYIETEAVRQDLRFQTEQSILTLRAHCLWLVRRIGREVFFRTGLAMERALRAPGAVAAYDVYLRLIEIQDLEHDFVRLDDCALAKRLLEGRLEQYRDLDTLLVPQ